MDKVPSSILNRPLNCCRLSPVVLMGAGTIKKVQCDQHIEEPVHKWSRNRGHQSPSGGQNCRELSDELMELRLVEVLKDRQSADHIKGLLHHEIAEVALDEAMGRPEGFTRNNHGVERNAWPNSLTQREEKRPV